MTSEPPDPSSEPPPNVAALVDAIDARARQAGSEGATAVLQRMLGSVTDVLGGIQDRLDQVEAALTSGGGAGGPPSGLAEAVESGLASFNARLGRLEAAFVQAVDESGSGTQAVVDEVRTVVTRALEESTPADASSGEAIEAALSPMLDRLDSIVDQVIAALRREAELLTQRVAALAVGVEASRVLLEQQLQDAENSIGRKAGDVTRRLASDFGIKTRRSGPGGRRDPRELGSG